MSCEWGLDCEDCGERTEVVFNHGQDRLRELVKNVDVIKKVRDASFLTVCWITGDEHFDDFFLFAEKHRGHRTFTMVNEYGQYEWFD